MQYFSQYQGPHRPPSYIKGVRVIPDEEIIRIRDEDWITLVPNDAGNPHLWEYSLTTGRLIQTR